MLTALLPSPIECFRCSFQLWCFFVPGHFLKCCLSNIMIFWTTFWQIQGITFLLIYLTPTTSNQPQSQVTFLPLCTSCGHQDGQLLSSFFAFQPLTWSMSLQFRWLQWWTRWKRKRNGRSEHFFSDCAVRVNMGYAPWHTSSDSTDPSLPSCCFHHFPRTTCHDVQTSAANLLQ